MKVFFTCHQYCLHTSIWTIFHVTQTFGQNSLWQGIMWESFHPDHCQSQVKWKLQNIWKINAQTSAIKNCIIYHSRRHHEYFSSYIVLRNQKSVHLLEMQTPNNFIPWIAIPKGLTSRYFRLKDKLMDRTSINRYQRVQVRMSPLTSQIQELQMPREYKGSGAQKNREAHVLSLNPMPCCHCHRINTRTHGPLFWPRRTFIELSCSMNKNQIDFSIMLRKLK